MESKRSFEISRAFQHYLDRSAPKTLIRWVGTLAATSMFALRVFVLQGFYAVAYCVGVYAVQLLIGFLSPRDDPEAAGLEGVSLPMRGSDEFKPFVRRLPEFMFWYSITKALCVAFVMTFFSIFNIPVFWSILLFYWILIAVICMRRRIQHMIKHKYVPFSIGKKRYGGKKASASNGGKKASPSSIGLSDLTGRDCLA